MRFDDRQALLQTESVPEAIFQAVKKIPFTKGRHCPWKVIRHLIRKEAGIVATNNYEENAIRAVVDTWASAMRAKDAERVAGERVDLWFRETLGFCKIDGQWKIAHEHSSVPFYMDGSFKAAIDLKP